MYIIILDSLIKFLFSMLAFGSDIYTTTPSTYTLNSTPSNNSATELSTIVTTTITSNNITSTYFPVHQQTPLSKSIEIPGTVYYFI